MLSVDCDFIDVSESWGSLPQEVALCFIPIEPWKDCDARIFRALHSNHKFSTGFRVIAAWDNNLWSLKLVCPVQPLTAIDNHKAYVPTYYLVLLLQDVTSKEHVYGMLRITSRIHLPSLYSHGANVLVIRQSAAGILNNDETSFIAHSP